MIRPIRKRGSQRPPSWRSGSIRACSLARVRLTRRSEPQRRSPGTELSTHGRCGVAEVVRRDRLGLDLDASFWGRLACESPRVRESVRACKSGPTVVGRPGEHARMSGVAGGLLGRSDGVGRREKPPRDESGFRAHGSNQRFHRLQRHAVARAQTTAPSLAGVCPAAIDILIPQGWRRKRPLTLSHKPKRLYEIDNDGFHRPRETASDGRSGLSASEKTRSEIVALSRAYKKSKTPRVCATASRAALAPPPLKDENPWCRRAEAGEAWCGS